MWHRQATRAGRRTTGPASRLCILGGSSLSTPVLIEALLCQRQTATFEVVLAGRDPERLALIAAVSQALVPDGDDALTVRIETEPERALAGADLVVNQIRPGGLEGRAFDETFPHALGLPGEETLGPGGFSSACRSVPTVLALARIAERVAPDCLWLNLTNPCSLVQTALQAHTDLTVIGLCELPLVVLQRAVEALPADSEPRPTAVAWTLAGINHISWLTAIQIDGRDRLAELLARVDTLPKLGIDADLVRRWGALPMPFLRYYVHPDRTLAEQRGKPPRAREVEAVLERELACWRASDVAGPRAARLARGQRRALAEQLAGSLARSRGAVWHSLIVAPVVLALAERRSGVWPLNLPNRGRIPGLPDGAIVETDVRFENGRPVPCGARPLPLGVIDLVARHQAFEQRAADAIVARDRAKALEALRLNPMIQTHAQAEGALAQAWAQIEC
jgi:6-phospho-beta-glucosidase